jgi:hypothetical protein
MGILGNFYFFLVRKATRELFIYAEAMASMSIYSISRRLLIIL